MVTNTCTQQKWTTFQVKGNIQKSKELTFLYQERCKYYLQVKYICTIIFTDFFIQKSFFRSDNIPMLFKQNLNRISKVLDKRSQPEYRQSFK